MKDTLIDSLSVAQEALNKSNTGGDWFTVLLENNPGLFTILITGLLLPLGMLWLNNRNTKKLKELEKQLDEKYQGKAEIKNQERAIYSSLSKILFDVQQLHVSLSGTCIDKNCIDNAVSKFDTSITKYHDEISNNLLYMPSIIIDNIYKFYSKISDLKVSLKEFNDTQNFEMAHVCVYSYSIELSEILINIQELLIAENIELKKNFDKAEQEMMKYCCGRKPPKDVVDRYIELLPKVKTDLTETEIEEIKLSLK
ncbi:MAG: hypothetical protein HWE22_15970 [Flavobacteriales bacterium]|nr:hypothetical protein [Flavobacteriales bacterium]